MLRAREATSSSVPQDRPCFHLAPKQGWINDPNVCARSLYCYSLQQVVPARQLFWSMLPRALLHDPTTYLLAW
jgi:hypothetical protein